MFFWIIKILATTVGETFADLLGTHLDLSLTTTTVMMSALLAVILAFQCRAREYGVVVYLSTTHGRGDALDAELIAPESDLESVDSVR